MPDYSKSKIYKIICNITGLVYIGSTCQTLNQRLQEHKRKYKCYLNEKFHYISSYKILENSNYDIILIEDFPCERREQLLSRERYWIENIECVNMHIPSRTEKEWREDNKEKIQINNKEYRENNKEKIIVYMHNYQKDNKDYFVEYKKLWYNNNKEKIKQQRKEYRENNKEKIKEYYQKKKLLNDTIMTA